MPEIICNTCFLRRDGADVIVETRRYAREGAREYVRPKCRPCYKAQYQPPRPRMEQGERPCIDCGLLQPHEDFPPLPGRKNRERGTRDGKCIECRRAYRRETWRKTGKDAALRRNFNITIDDFEAMLERQGGRCAICKADSPRGGHNWAVDHDHNCCPEKGRSCGKCVRQLLCLPCNTLLGAAEDNVDRLMAAAAYLLSTQDVVGGISRMNPVTGQ